MKRAAGIILIKDGKVLLVKAGEKSHQLNGTIATPGGGVEPGETDEAAARREFTEETGLVPGKLINFPGNYIEYNVILKEGPKDVSFKVFIANDFTGELRATDEVEPFWLDIQEARKIKLLGKNNELLENAIKFLGTA